jgi:ABC-type nitrate/sulfonate/bicarbonate transport system substrate-binding protein
MKKNIQIILILLFGLLVVLSIYHVTKDQFKGQKKTTEKLIPFTVVLDWTPNTNHTGMYVALAKRWYKEQGLDVKILPYASGTSPEVLVTSGKADVGVSTTEGVVSSTATGNPVVSIAAIMQHNTSGFMALADSGIKTAKDLDNKIYGGYGTPIESAILHKIITTDGGKGIYKSANLDVAAMQALTDKQIDFFWVFEGWEVIQAKHQGLNVVYFPSSKYGISDYYTPVLMTSTTEIKEKPELLRKFMAATSKGYQYTIDHPKESADLLIATAPKGTFSDTEFIEDSQKFLSAHYVDRGRMWGLQDKKVWHEYPQFIIDVGGALDKNSKPIKSLDFDSLYTNEFLQ